jgi:lipoyl(octanoyl) transferase
MEWSTWRLIETPPAHGAWNMAVDEAILEAVGQKAVPPTLRLFAWNPPCLSLGYAQPFSDVDQARLQAHGWEVVRRPTGGRAILHTDELTYSVIAPLTEPRVYGSILESYRRLSQALLQALELLGLPARADKEHTLPSGMSPSGPVCFEVPSNYEITFGGKKLIGSAQARRREGVLQHGSLPLVGDLTRITHALVFSDEAERQVAAQRLIERAATVEECIHQVVDWRQAAEAFKCGFEQTLDLHLELADLSAQERRRADELVVQKYAHPDWTRRV